MYRAFSHTSCPQTCIAAPIIKKEPIFLVQSQCLLAVLSWWQEGGGSLEPLVEVTDPIHKDSILMT